MKKLLLAVVATTAMTMCGPVVAADQGTAKPITSGNTKPHLGNGPADEKSLPSDAPAATTHQTTGATDQSSTVKSMNSSEQAKVDRGGK